MTSVYFGFFRDGPDGRRPVTVAALATYGLLATGFLTTP